MADDCEPRQDHAAQQHRISRTSSHREANLVRLWHLSMSTKVLKLVSVIYVGVAPDMHPVGELCLHVTCQPMSCIWVFVFCGSEDVDWSATRLGNHGYCTFGIASWRGRALNTKDRSYRGPGSGGHCFANITVGCLTMQLIVFYLLGHPAPSLGSIFDDR